MKKQQVDHVLRAAGRITGEKQFVIIGSQSLHGKYPDLADAIVSSAEVDLIASNKPDRTESSTRSASIRPFTSSSVTTPNKKTLDSPGWPSLILEWQGRFPTRRLSNRIAANCCRRVTMPFREIPPRHQCAERLRARRKLRNSAICIGSGFSGQGSGFRHNAALRRAGGATQAAPIEVAAITKVRLHKLGR